MSTKRDLAHRLVIGSDEDSGVQPGIHAGIV